MFGIRLEARCVWICVCVRLINLLYLGAKEWQVSNELFIVLGSYHKPEKLGF